MHTHIYAQVEFSDEQDILKNMVWTDDHTTSMLRDRFERAVLVDKKVGRPHPGSKTIFFDGVQD